MKTSLFSVILFFALTSVAQQRHYYTGEDIAPDTVFAIDSDVSTVAVEARCALRHAREGAGEGDSWWGIAWNYISPDDYEYVILRPYNTDFGSLTDKRVMGVEYGVNTGGVMIRKSREIMSSGVNMAKGYNSLLLEWGKAGLRVFAGSKELHKALEVDTQLPVSRECKLISSVGIDINSLVVECVADKAKSLAAGYDMDDLMSCIASSVDPMEGVWRYLDRENDESRARLGGNYSLIIIGNGNGYDLLYHDGARVNAAQWKPLMLKGTLAVTPFQRHYNLVWYDSMMDRLDEETHATLSEEGILSLEFPLYHSRLRFYKAADFNP